MTDAFKRDTEYTPVVFRKYGPRRGGAVIALFIHEAWTRTDPYMCTCYVHVGQHGAADPRLVVQQTRPARPADYADLKKELESAPYGYRFSLYHRVPSDAADVRRRKMEAMK